MKKTYHFELEKYAPKVRASLLQRLALLFSLQPGELLSNSNEITVSFPSLAFAKGGVTITITPGTLSISVTGIHSIRDLVTLSTSNLSLSKGNVGTIGIYFIWNHDLTNVIQIGGDGTTYPMALNAGEFGFGRWNVAAMQVKASAGTPQLEYCLIEA